MKNKKMIGLLIAVLAVITVFAAVIHNNSREEIPEDAIVLTINGQTKYITAQDIDQTDITGTTVNGKGEEKTVEARGVYFSELFKDEAYETAVCTADDEYSAEVEYDEAGNACLILKDDNSVTLIVFGDQNSKRNVKNIVSIELK